MRRRQGPSSSSRPVAARRLLFIRSSGVPSSSSGAGDLGASADRRPASRLRLPRVALTMAGATQFGCIPASAEDPGGRIGGGGAFHYRVPARSAQRFGARFSSSGGDEDEGARSPAASNEPAGGRTNPGWTTMMVNLCLFFFKITARRD
uniref:Uncharacterized protein n=1 Tax=Arundo donax TaxID=35708 RepID=A0A0A9D5J5_ARUDO